MLLNKDNAHVRFQLDMFFKKNAYLCPIEDLYVDPRLMFIHISEHHKVDALTYTYKEWPTTRKFPLRRLVVGLRPQSISKNIDTRILEGLHTKLYLGFSSKNKLEAAYISSQNLVKPTTLNLGMKITERKKLKLLQEYFEAIWLLAKKN